jgi:carbon starvation protein
MPLPLAAISLSAMPVMIVVLCCLAIAYRYYSAFLAARVAVLDDTRLTPAVRMNDGQNYHPTSKWVLFGHHFAAISGAGPLVGPVLAAQFGYLPGLLWIVIGVCLGGAVQDFLVLAASLRRNGKSLAQIAYGDVGRIAGTAATASILFIVIIALAGLGKVVVKALGGEAVKYPDGSRLVLTSGGPPARAPDGTYVIPAGTTLQWGNGRSIMAFTDSFKLKTPTPIEWTSSEAMPVPGSTGAGIPWHAEGPIPTGSARIVPGSSWGTFTIACTIPIALLVGLWMYKLRPGKTVEASIVGAALTLGAVFLGGWIKDTAFGHAFNLTDKQVIWAMAIYGFVAAVLPVWVLLAPRDYLSSFLKIGTIALLVIGVIVANPQLQAPAVNTVFLGGGPVLGKGSTIFPFLFITIMCGAISGFHALVSSGTTPKMVMRESHARTIGYGAMLIEGLVGVVAMIAAASLSPQDYYGMNTPLAAAPQWHDQIMKVGGGGGVEHLNQYEQLTQEPLRGRVGGAVTLAVGMAHIFDTAAQKASSGNATFNRFAQKLWAYWYHFAIMFEALFILTTIDAGTRIGRFLVQEVAGKLHAPLGRTSWWPGAIASTALVVAGWAWFIDANSFDVVWRMFGIANQMLAVIALAIVSAYLANEGRARYLWVTGVPMLVVMTTTGAAGARMLGGLMDAIRSQLSNPSAPPQGHALANNLLLAGLIVGMLLCAAIVVIAAAVRVSTRMKGEPTPARAFEPVIAK